MTDILLIQKILDEVASPEEIANFREMLQGMDQQEYARWIDAYLDRAKAIAPADGDKWRDTRSLEVLLQRINEQRAGVHFLRTTWFRYAAAVLLIVAGIGVFYTFYRNSPSDTRVVRNTPSLPVDVAPASDKAVLTLSNGQQVQLNNGASETIKDGALPIENKNGRLVYNGGEAGIQGQTGNAADVAVNTMTTPNGGLYKLTLADGTKVWLNAASSITYPVAFAGAHRKVSITGEVYFEVAKDEKRPFIVDVNGKSTVEVLGTSFNINSYTNEEAVKTTLLEGSVRVSKAGQSALLTPGGQAVVANSGPGITVKTNADVDQAMAWRNGLFTFNNADLPSVTRQLERWYDIKVVYLGKVPEIILKGKMYRNVNLSDVLEFLKTSGVATRMEGKTLIVL